MSTLSKLFRTYWKPRSTRDIDLLSTRYAADFDWPAKINAEAQAAYFQTLADGLRSKELLLVAQKCPCGQTTHDTLISQRDRYGLHFNSVICDACGTVRLDPYFDEKSLSTFYSKIYQGLYARATQPEEYFDRQLVYGQKIKQSTFSSILGDGSSVLEVGCGAGGGLAAFQYAGFDVQGCDYSAELVEYGKARGVNGLQVGPVNVIAATGKKFDLIYLHHVFEHVGTPIPTLRTIERLLKPKGRLIIIVPNIELVAQYHRGKGDPLKFIHVSHKYNYTLTCFEQMARKTQLEATLFHPTDTRTAWNDAPELWVELKCVRQCLHAALKPHEFKGKQMLKALKKAERAYLAKLDDSKYKVA